MIALTELENVTHHWPHVDPFYGATFKSMLHNLLFTLTFLTHLSVTESYLLFSGTFRLRRYQHLCLVQVAWSAGEIVCHFALGHDTQQ